MRALSRLTALLVAALLSACTFNTDGINIGAAGDGGRDTSGDLPPGSETRPDAPGDAPGDGKPPADSTRDMPSTPDACVLVDGGIPPTAGIDAPPATITIDGNFDDWACASWFRLDVNTADSTSGPSPSKVSATWTVAWDKDAVYVAVRVNDPIVVGDDKTNIYKNDSVEIYIDGDGQLNGEYDADTAQLLVDHAGRVFRGPTPQKNPPGVNAAVTVVSGGYNVEMRIEGASLLLRPSVPALKANDRLAFDIAVNSVDANGAVRTQLIWRDRGTLSCTCATCCCGQSPDEPYCDSLHFEPLRLRP